MIETLKQLVGVPVGGGASATGSGEGSGGTRSTAITSAGGREGTPLVVDDRRNLIIFRGSGKDWAEIRAVVEQLDKPVPSVLVEVLIAEISLTGKRKAVSISCSTAASTASASPAAPAMPLGSANRVFPWCSTAPARLAP